VPSSALTERTRRAILRRRQALASVRRRSRGQEIPLSRKARDTATAIVRPPSSVASPPAPSAAPAAGQKPAPADPPPPPRGRPVPVAALPTGSIARPWLRVATITDDFSAMAFRYEWNGIAVTPSNWREVLQADPPDLLFVESAWVGNGGAWQYHVLGLSAPRQPLRDLVDWCREHKIPTVFWNKEDPPHFDECIKTAALFDYVLTTDVQCVPRYHEHLGHERVGVLPFAAQPMAHNPLRVTEHHKRTVAFAGTYFTDKFPERRAQTELLLDPAREFDLEIFSRHYGGMAKYQFPERFSPHMFGSLSYDRMLTAYKQYKIFLNVNSVVDSPSMCARRIFEISACGSAVVSGETAALEHFFPGGIVPISRSHEQTRPILRTLLGDDETRDRMVALAKRITFRDHTYGHRVRTVLDLVGLPDRRVPVPVTAVVPLGGRAQADREVLADLARQSRRPDRVVVVGESADGVDLPDGARRGADDLAAVLAQETGHRLALFLPGCRYGEHHLEDLVLATCYAGTPALGRRARWIRDTALGALVLVDHELEHTRVERVAAGSVVVTVDDLPEKTVKVAAGLSVGQLADVLARTQVPTTSIDRFNYIDATPSVDDGTAPFDLLTDRPLSGATRSLPGAGLAAVEV
jgi:hypothetical protein